jgi:hypothetical protein
MKMKMYSIFDRAVAAYLPPFLANTDAHAMRMVRESTIGQSDNQLVLHHADYALYYIADWDPQDGDLVPPHKPIAIASVSEIIQPSNWSETIMNGDTSSDVQIDLEELTGRS